jgi:hypothetical protein
MPKHGLSNNPLSFKELTISGSAGHGESARENVAGMALLLRIRDLFDYGVGKQPPEAQAPGGCQSIAVSGTFLYNRLRYSPVWSGGREMHDHVGGGTLMNHRPVTGGAPLAERLLRVAPIGHLMSS